MSHYRIKTIRPFLITCMILLMYLPLFAQETVLFTSAQEGYTCFRIPALVTWGNDQVFAFAEGRKDNCSDFGNVDIVMKHSADGGKTWGPLQVVVDNGNLQAGNPAPVLDLLDGDFPEGRLFLFYNTGTASEYETRMGKGRRRGFYITSSDFGKTWSKAMEFTHQVHFDIHSDRPEVDARSWALTPGHAIQLREGPYAGRLIIAANHSLGEPQEEFRDYRAYSMYSDDHGLNWQISKDLAVPSSNEAMAAQVSETEVVMTVRMQNSYDRTKLMALSKDGGASWDSTWMAKDLPTPMCQSSILSIFTPEKRQLLHVGPANTNSRTQLTLWSSSDKGRRWKTVKEIWSGSAAYSDMVDLGGGDLGVLYERNSYNQIVFTILVL